MTRTHHTALNNRVHDNHSTWLVLASLFVEGAVLRGNTSSRERGRRRGRIGSDWFGSVRFGLVGEGIIKRKCVFVCVCIEVRLIDNSTSVLEKLEEKC